VDALIKALFEYDDAIDNLEDVMGKLARYYGTSRRVLWAHVQVEEEMPGTGKRARRAQRIQLRQSQEDVPVGDVDDEDDDYEEAEQVVDKGKEEEEDLSASLVEEVELMVAASPPPPADVATNISALNALCKTFKLLKPADDRDLYNLTKSTMAACVAALNKGITEMEGVQFSVRDRAEALGYDMEHVSVQQVGKVAHEYYRAAYQGAKPPQRLVANGNGQTYMMNMYTAITAPSTVDRALREAFKKRRL